MNPILLSYLKDESYLQPSCTPTCDDICHLVVTSMQSQSQDLMKLRSENIKLKQTLKDLQEKVSIHAGNNNNTDSSFMMASQFKVKFEEFMKETVSLTLSPLLSDPGKYSSVLALVLKTCYQDTEDKLNHILTGITHILKISGQQKPLLRQLLKILQDNHPQLLVSDCKKYQAMWLKIDDSLDVQSEDFEKMLVDCHNLVVYMLLQEQKWEVVFGEDKSVEFLKKDFTCIDGWIKEKEKGLLLIEGLRKGNGQLHPNLKNYVIPMPKDYVPKPVELPLTQSNLTQSNLTQSNLTQSNLTQSNLTQSNLTQSKQLVEQVVVTNVVVNVEEKRIKTLEESRKILVEKESEISVQLEGRLRKPSLSNMPVKVVGKIVKQTWRASTQRRVQNQTSRSKAEKKVSKDKEKDKENICLNIHSLNYREIIKRKFKDERSVLRTKDFEKRVMLYDSSMPDRTDRSQKEREGSSHNRRKKEENRPLKPTEGQMAKMKAKHKLL